MNNITPTMVKKIENMAKIVCKHHPQLKEDAIQEGFVRVLEMPENQTESYYIQGAIFRMREYVRKEVLHLNREGYSITEIKESVQPLGNKRRVVPEIPEEYESKNDIITAKWLRGY